MAYQNVGTPRFYINVLEWLETVGYFATTGAAIENHFRTLPVNPQLYWGEFAYDIPNVLGTENFIAILGHELATDNNNYSLLNWSGDSEIVNGAPATGYNGFSISIFTNQLEHISPRFETYESNIGSVIIGTYYDMPNAPNLSLTMSREYGGTKEITTHNGGSMSNAMWSKPYKWGSLGAWELGDSNPALSRSGRKTWDLKFSYMDDSDLWGSNQAISISRQDPYDGLDDADTNAPNNPNVQGNFEYTILTDTNFFSQVWHKTLGGTLPFIFQPDKNNNNPDQFAICKFKNNSLKATQSAFNVYDISLSIEEVW